MMNSKVTKIAVEGMGIVALALCFSYASTYIPVKVDIALLPLLFFAFRQGVIPSVVVNALFAVGNALIFSHTGDIVVDNLVAYEAVLLAALFARNTVRTAFNARVSSTTLNIVTGTVASVTVSWAVHSVSSILNDTSFLFTTKQELGVAFTQSLSVYGTTLCVLLLILVGMVYINRMVYVPKGTRFLTRKETSHLLNS